MLSVRDQNHRKCIIEGVDSYNIAALKDKGEAMALINFFWDAPLIVSTILIRMHLACGGQPIKKPVFYPSQTSLIRNHGTRRNGKA